MVTDLKVGSVLFYLVCILYVLNQCDAVENSLVSQDNKVELQRLVTEDYEEELMFSESLFLRNNRKLQNLVSAHKKTFHKFRNFHRPNFGKSESQKTNASGREVIATTETTEQGVTTSDFQKVKCPSWPLQGSKSQLCQPFEALGRRGYKDLNSKPLIFGDGLCDADCDSHEQRGSPAADLSSPLDVKGVCSFDIDLTLMPGDTTPPDCRQAFLGAAQGAVQRCRDLGLGVALNTAQRHCVTRRGGRTRGVVTSLDYLRKVGFEDLELHSRAFQFFSVEKACSMGKDPKSMDSDLTQAPLKVLALEAIAAYYKVNNTCVLHFDDKHSLGDAIQQNYFNFIPISNERHRPKECGISTGELDAGIKLLSENCQEMTKLVKAESLKGEDEKNSTGEKSE